jgi:hypothetical protein
LYTKNATKLFQNAKKNFKINQKRILTTNKINQNALKIHQNPNKFAQTFYNPYILQTLSPIFVSVSPVSSNSHTLFPTSLFFFLSSLLFSTSPTQNQPPTHSKHRKNTTKAPKNNQSRFSTSTHLYSSNITKNVINVITRTREIWLKHHSFDPQISSTVRVKEKVELD